MNVFFFSVALLMQAENLECPERPEWEGDSGSWIPEEHVTEANARKALEHLEKYINGEITDLSASGWELDSSVKLVEGFIFKRLAASAKHGKKAQNMMSRYCLWLERRGQYLGAIEIGGWQNNKSLQLTSYAGS